MTEFFLAYGLFLAKTATVVVAIAVVIGLLLVLRRGNDDDNQLSVRKLNDRYTKLADAMAEATLDKDEHKARVKARRKQEKQERKAAKAARKAGEEARTRPRVFVLGFRGDIRASAVSSLREEITALLTMVDQDDEVLVRLENAGGHAHEHGLAASQLLRLREHGTRLTIAVDKVAASGGYMMACVGERIIAAPFAILGSIGVLLQLPNFHRLLEGKGVDFEMVKGGEFKRTLTVFGENSPEARAKAQSEVEDIHALFKEFVAEQRPALDIDKVATGEHWFGRRALDLKLCDAIRTSDDYLLERAREADVYEVRYKRRKPVYQKLADAGTRLFRGGLDTLADTDNERRLGAG